jgi:methylated-DNA-protein-cysteine methyltransferase-like protein
VTVEPDDRFTEAVIRTVESIPRGEISTYGEVAQEAGFPGAARAVGNLLRTTPGLPWWRVIAANGRLVPGLEADHAQRLRAEGVEIRNGAVVMGKAR